MRAGELRERVTVQAATVSRDDFGAEVITWADVATVWAKVLVKSGREPVLADRPVMLVGYEVTIRLGVAVSQKHRLMWRGKVLDIDAVNLLPGAGLVTLLCSEADVLGGGSPA